MPILLETERFMRDALAGAIGPETLVARDIVAVRRHLTDLPNENLVVIGPDVELAVALDFASAERIARPVNGVILVRRRVDTAVLKDAIRAGVREVVKADDLRALTEACRQSQALSQRVRGDVGDTSQPNGGLGQLITVFSAKGGCGKTTLSTNIAGSLSKAGHRVCIIDLDLAFGDVAIAMQLFPTRSVADAVELTSGMDTTAVRGLVTPYSENLDTVLAPIEPGAGEAVPAQTVTDLLQALKRSYEYVVVDTPPQFNDHVLAACDATDLFVLIATLDIAALKNLKLTLEMLDLLGYARDRRRVVLNRSDSKVGLSVNDAQKTLGTPIAGQIPSSGDVPASINRGVPIVLDHPSHPVSLAVKAFTATLVRDATPTVLIPRQQRRGLALLRRTETKA